MIQIQAQAHLMSTDTLVLGHNRHIRQEVNIIIIIVKLSQQQIRAIQQKSSFLEELIN